jgi:hypothetical protein
LPRAASEAADTRFGVIAALLLFALAGSVTRYLLYYRVTGDTDLARFVETTCAWDCGWYRGIVTTGYGEPGTPAGANRAFFPLYPAIVWVLRQATGWSPALSGYACSTLFTLVAAWLAQRWFGANRAAWWLFAFSLLVGPFSLLLSILYTEALFVLLSILALNAINRCRWLEAALWIALLSTTRVTGVLMGFALVAGFAVAHARAGGTLTSLLPAALRSPRFLAALLIAPLGMLGYMLYLHIETGDALTFLHVQSTWNRHLQSPLATLLTALTNLWSTDPVMLTDVGAHWATLVGLGLSIVLAHRGRVPEAVFCLAVLIISMSAGSGSMLRFTAGLVPLGMLVCELLASRRTLYLAAYPVSLVLGLLAAMVWYSGSTLLV